MASFDLIGVGSPIMDLLARVPDQQERYFLQATRLDARFGHPSYELGKMHYDRKESRQAADWLEKVAPEDVHYREASFLLGLALFHFGDFAASEMAFQSVAEAVPLSAVLNTLGAAQNRRNLPQAIDSFRAINDWGEGVSMPKFPPEIIEDIIYRRPIELLWPEG